MEIYLNSSSIDTLKALANPSRVRIIELVGEHPRNITSIAEELALSPSIVTRHIQQLEKCNIIKVEPLKDSQGNQKICYLNIDELNIRFPNKIHNEYKQYTVDIPVGSYTQFDVQPTCGLASETSYIGSLDVPKFFMDPSRHEAQLIWFANGYVEYSFINPIDPTIQKVHLIQISFEIASEFPENNYVWPSDVTFLFNGSNIGTWTCPGNFADVRGKYTPSWWPSSNSQYGVYKNIRITPNETQIDGEKISNYKLSNVPLNSTYYTFRFMNPLSAKNVGGITLFGEKFGNYQSNIKVTFFYTDEPYTLKGD